MGSGSTLVAAAQLGRRYVGYDLDAGYVELARHRVDEVELHHDGLRSEAFAEGASATALAEQVVTAAGFTIEHRDRRMADTAVTADLVATDARGGTWYFLVGGPMTETRGGLLRMDVVWRTLGQAAALRGRHADIPVVILTSDPPRVRSDGDIALQAARPNVIFDVVDVLSADGRDRLREYAVNGADLSTR
jgi:site-specific DNA-methyltransferase (adenine-specific)